MIKVNINQEGLELIKKFEGCKLVAYKCPAGVWTIGYGHTRTVQPNMIITMETAEILLKQDIEEAQKQMRPLITRQLNLNQASALTSFVFNLGIGNFKSSTLLKKVNQSKDLDASKEFLKWAWASGKILEGLIARRCAESKLYLKPSVDVWLD